MPVPEQFEPVEPTPAVIELQSLNDDYEPVSGAEFLEAGLGEKRPRLRRWVRLGDWSTARVALVCIIVVLVAGLATLGGLLVRTRGALDHTEHVLADTSAKLASTGQSLTSTQGQLDVASTKLSDTERKLAETRTALDKAHADTRQATEAADDLADCAGNLAQSYNNIFAWNDSQYEQCMRGLNEWGALHGVSGDGSSV